MPRPKMARRAPVASRATPAASASRAAGASSDVETTYRPTRSSTRNTRASTSRMSVGETEALTAASASRDAALDRLANEDVTTTSGPTAADDEDSGSLEIGRRAMATPAQRRDTTGLDLIDDSMFGNLDDSFEDGDLPRAPLSAETTSLSLSNFKTRSRQSSFVGRNDPPIRPSSRGGNTPGVSSSFNIGLFRRRAREPSILGTARKARADATGGTTLHSDAGSDGELGDFAPEAESTPINNRRRTRQAATEREPSQELATSSATRKRKSQVASDGSPRPEKATRVEAEDRADSDSDSDLSELSSPPARPAAFLNRPVTPNRDEEIMAPPLSSGSEDEGDDAWPDIHTLGKRRRRPSVTTPLRSRADDMSDMSSPPSLTHSPNFDQGAGAKGRGRSAVRRHRSPKLTTADFMNLLPKRRYKKNRETSGHGSDGELDPSGLGQDDDELSHLDTQASRRRKDSRAASRSGRTASALKEKQTPTSARPVRRTRSYAHLNSDKENESGGEEDDQEESRFVPVADDTFDSGPAQAVDSLTAEELKQAAKKFKEVDRWELEYEEVAEPSSPLGAR